MTDGKIKAGHGLIETLKVYSEPKIAMMLVLGFAAGLPFLLYFSTLGFWLENSDVDVALIGFFSWFGLAYSFKFLWAPIVDRFDPPGFARMFGRRRAWIFVAQIGVAVGLAGIGLSDPTRNLAATALFSFLLAFSSATQDIGIDAWRIEAASNDDEQGPLAAAYQYGYKVGMIIAGGVALFIAEFAGFPIAYIAMAACMITAAIVFSIWDRPTGLKAAGAAGVALLSIGLFSAFGALGELPLSQWAHWLMFGLKWLFIIITGISSVGFLTALVMALMSPGNAQRFHAFDIFKGLLFAIAGIGAIGLVAALIGAAIPALLSVLSIELSKGDVGKIAVYIALAPIIACLILTPLIRRLKPDAPLLTHPALGAFVDFFWRNGWIAVLILLFVSAYRLSDIVMGIMAKPAYSAMGYSAGEVGLMSGIYGVWIVFVGVALAGVSAIKLGLRTSLVIGAVVSVIGNIAFAWLVNQSSDSLFPLFVAITADNIAGGFAGTIFVAYMSTLVNKSFAGTQYAIFSSIYSLGPKLLAGTSGLIVAQHGYSNFFLFAAALGIPAIFLSLFADRWRPQTGTLDG